MFTLGIFIICTPQSNLSSLPAPADILDSKLSSYIHVPFVCGPLSIISYLTKCGLEIIQQNKGNVSVITSLLKRHEKTPPPPTSVSCQ